MCTSTPSLPPAMAPPPPPAPNDPSVQAQLDAERRRQAAARFQTLLTSGQGAGTAGQQAPNPQPPKTLIGA